MSFTIIEKALGNLSESITGVERTKPERTSGKVDIEKVIFPLQYKYLFELENDKRFDDIYDMAKKQAHKWDKLAKKLDKEWDIGSSEPGTKYTFLASGDYIRLSERSSKTIFEALSFCSELLAVNFDVEIFKGKSLGFGASENALIIKHSEKTTSIIFDNDILNTIANENELRYILGHELGHLIGPQKSVKLSFIYFTDIDLVNLYNDPGLTKKEIRELEKDINSSRELMVQNGEISNFADLLLSIYPKSEEITCDRFGLLCCGNKEDAITASMKLHSGPDDPFSEYVAKDIIEQGIDLMRAMSENPELIKRTPYYSADHPHPFLRASCLDSFAKSETFNRLYGKKGKDDAKVNDECGAIFLIFNGLLPKKPRGKKEVKKGEKRPEQRRELKKQEDDTLAVFEFLCFLLIATADEKITPAEEKNYYKKFSRLSVEKEEDLLSKTDDELDKLFTEFADVVSGMHGRTKAALIKRLFGLIRADRKISDVELQVLAEIAKTIGAEKSCERILTDYYGYLPVNL